MKKSQMLCCEKEVKIWSREENKSGTFQGVLFNARCEVCDLGTNGWSVSEELAKKSFKRLKKMKDKK